MQLKQNHKKGELTKEQKQKIYKNFKSRVNKKSKHRYFDEDEEPILLRIYMIGSIFNATQEYLVVFGSFEVIVKDEKEIGFKAEIRTIDDEYWILTVYKEKFRANIQKK